MNWWSSRDGDGGVYGALLTGVCWPITMGRWMEKMMDSENKSD